MVFRWARVSIDSSKMQFGEIFRKAEKIVNNVIKFNGENYCN